MQSSYIDSSVLRKILNYIPWKYKLICHTALWTGWRINDIITLKVSEIDNDTDTITITEKKTGKVSTRKLENWQLVELLRNSHNGLIFEGRKKHRPIARQTIWRHIKRACERAGVDTDGISAHSIRKLWAVNKFHETRSIMEVSKLMNHKYITTTMLYCFSDQIS